MGDRGVDQLEVDIRVGRLDGFNPAPRPRPRRATSLGAFRTQNTEAHDRGAVEARKGPGLRDRIGDESEIVEPHFAAGRQGDPRRCEVGDRLGAGKRADGLIAAADLGPPAGEIHVAAAKLAADIERRQADGLKPDRIEPDADFALDASDALDPGDPAHPCNARITTSSTNQESCSGVLPGAIAA